MSIQKIKLTIVACLFMCTSVIQALGQQAGAVITLDIGTIKTDTLMVTGRDPVIYAKPKSDGKYVIPLNGTFPKILSIIIPNLKNGRLSVYVEKGDALSIVTDFNGHTTFSGKGANNAKVFEQNFAFMMKSWRGIDIKKDTTTPDDLYRQFDEMFKTPFKNLEANRQKVASSFYRNHYDFIFYQDLGYKLDVPFWYMRETGSPLSKSIPANYWDLLKKVKLNGPALNTEEFNSTMFSSFPQFLENEYKFKSGNPDGEFNEDTLFMAVYRRIEALTSGPLRNKILEVRLESKLEGMKDPAPLKPLITEYEQKYGGPGNVDNLKALKARYAAVEAMAPGRVPPPFVLKDKAGKDVTLNDFAGKVVYMDFWASWCAPCRAQMKEGAPGLHKRFEDNKDIVFLFVNLDKSKEAGLKAIAEDKIQGVHLFAGDFSADNPVARAFNISGIPRYVIIGKDGKLFDADAPRPSEEVTPVRLNEALNAK